MLVRAEFYPGSSKVKATDPTSSASSSSHQRLTLYAPKEALLNRDGNKAQVWIAANKRAQRRDLTLGSEERDGHLQVLEGLHSGDQLILPPHDELKNGSRVSVSPNNK